MPARPSTRPPHAVNPRALATRTHRSLPPRRHIAVLVAELLAGVAVLVLAAFAVSLVENTDRVVPVAPSLAAAKVRRYAKTTGLDLEDIACAPTDSSGRDFFCYGEDSTGLHFGVRAAVQANGSLVVKAP